MGEIVKLHIGCGERYIKDWIHIDQADFPHIDFHDPTRLEFDNGSVDEIYACHILEYWDRDEVIPVLQEWRRVLRSGGVLRIAVPDFDAIKHLCAFENIPLFRFIGPLYGKIKVNNRFFYHKTVWNYSELESVLIGICGFRDCYRYNWQEREPFISDKTYDDQSRAYYPHSEECIRTGQFKPDQTLISLNIEAIK